MMEDYIPDSEEDDDMLLTSAVISYPKVVQNLSKLPEDERNLICAELKQTRFSELVPDNDPSSTRIRQGHSFDLIENNSNRDELGGNDFLLRDSDAYHASDMHKRFNNEELEGIRRDLDSYDKELLFETENNQTMRRGLRKRNFASTHPYIADQAYWLGLSSKESLNEIYRETPDLDAIVKLLNQIYMKKRAKYLTDEKYKAKSFYAFLGKKPDFVRDMEQSSQYTQNSSQPSFPEEKFNGLLNDGSSSNESDLADSDSSFLIFNRKNHSTIIEDDEDDDEKDSNENNHEKEERILNLSEGFASPELSPDDSDSDSTEIMVRVGGKYRKEKSVLRGALPESAKRLDLYRSKIPRKFSKKPENLYRKGLAIKKTKDKSNKKYNLGGELFEFVDDDNYYQENPEFYQVLEPSANHAGLLSDNPDTDDSINILSDYSDSINTGSYEADNLSSTSYEDPKMLDKDSGKISSKKIQSKKNIDFGSRNDDGSQNDIYGKNSVITLDDITDGYDSAIEDNRINPQFVNSPSPSIRRNRWEKKPKSYLTIRAKEKGVSNNQNVNIKRVSSNKARKFNRLDSVSTRRSNRHYFGELTRKGIKDATNRITKEPSRAYKKGSDLTQNPKKSQKDILITDYYFLRAPNTSTTVFEAESGSTFIKPRDKGISYIPSYVQSLQNNQKKYSIEMSSNIVLGEFDMNKIHALNLGPSIISKKDSIQIALVGQKYSFTLVDKLISNINSEKLLLYISRLLNDYKTFTNELVKKELYQSVRGIIEWFLILQEAPNDSLWSSLTKILEELCKIRKMINISEKLAFFPYFLLLFYVFIQLSKRRILDDRSIKLKYSEFDRYCINYWTIYFQAIDIDDFNTFDEEGRRLIPHIESIHLMYLLFQNGDEIWWPNINKALNCTVQFKPLEGYILDMMYILASLVPSHQYSWSPFYIIYNALRLDDESVIHRKFIEIIHSLNERFSWPFEEKLIITLYATITSRKFSNFSDETNEPELIKILVTRDSIPDESFFEKFMHLLYCYVSSLPLGGNKKRLISKLFTSSHYYYQKGSKGFAMFVNRLNFILVLAQLSNVDLRNQIVDLVQRIKYSNDIKMFNTAISGLQVYSEIATNKAYGIPFDSYHIMVENLIELYVSLPGIKKLWKRLLINMDRFFLSNINSIYSFDNHFMFLALTQSLDFNKFTVETSLSFMKLLLKAINNIIDTEEFGLSEKNFDLILKIQGKCFSFLHSQMGRFPFLNALQEEKTTELIEISMKVWIRCSSMIKEVNWNVLILQKFPYMGNLYLREKFVLFFYDELLSFANISEHIDSIILVLLKALALSTTSPYLSSLLNHLVKSNNQIFVFKKEFFPEQLTSFQVLNFKLQIASNIIFNIAQDNKISKSSKSMYLEELIRSLNEEYNKNFLANNYEEYCKRIVETVQKYCTEFIQQSEEFRLLTRRLGIEQLELNEYRWRVLPLKEKLTCLNNELSSAIHFKKDIYVTLNRYISSDSFDLVYHLISIYMKAISNNQHDKWIYVSLLMEYFYARLTSFNVLISERATDRFLRLLIDIGYLQLKIKDRNAIAYEFHRTLAFTSTFAILKEAYYLFQGYKDKSSMVNIISEFIETYEKTTNDTPSLELRYPFSNYVLFDIQQPGSEIQGSIENTSQEELNKIRDVSNVCYKKLLILHEKYWNEDQYSSILPVNIDF